jgi:Flp pilus assembly protein TadD
LSRAGQHAAAVEPLKEACRNVRKDPVPHHLLGLAYLAAGEPLKARQELRKAADLAPRSVPILLALGDCHLQANEPQKAEACYSRAVALAPNDVESRRRLAALLAYVGKLSAARGLYQMLIEDGARTPLVFAGLIEASDYRAEEPEPPEYGPSQRWRRMPRSPRRCGGCCTSRPPRSTGC